MKTLREIPTGVRRIQYSAIHIWGILFFASLLGTPASGFFAALFAISFFAFPLSLLSSKARSKLAYNKGIYLFRRNMGLLAQTRMTKALDLNPNNLEAAVIRDLLVIEAESTLDDDYLLEASRVSTIQQNYQLLLKQKANNQLGPRAAYLENQVLALQQQICSMMADKELSEKQMGHLREEIDILRRQLSENLSMNETHDGDFSQRSSDPSGYTETGASTDANGNISVVQNG